MLNTKVMSAKKDGSKIRVSVEGAQDGKKQDVSLFCLCVGKYVLALVYDLMMNHEGCRVCEIYLILYIFLFY